MRARMLGVVTLLASLGTGCGSGTEPKAEVDYCLVEPILEEKCFGCHSEKAASPAPFSLVGAAAFQETYGGRPLYEVAVHAVETDYMPLGTSSGLAGSGGPLEPTEKERLLEWFEAGAPDCR